MKLTFDVDFEKQTIKRTDDCEPVVNSENYLEAEYTCTGYDEGMVLTPVFMRGTKLPVGARDVYIPSFTQTGDVVSCTVPSEVICGKGFIASIFAYDVNKDERITVDRLIIWLKESGYCGVQIPSKDIYVQILEMLASLNVDEIEAMVKQGEQIIGDGLEALNSAIDNGLTNLNNTADNGMTNINNTADNGMTNINNTADNGMTNINNTINAGVTTINDNVNAGVTTLANNTNANIDSINAAATANMDNINNVTNTNIGNINDVTNTNLDNINSVGDTVVANINSASTKAQNTISSLGETAQEKLNTDASQHIQNIDAEAEAKIAEIESTDVWEKLDALEARLATIETYTQKAVVQNLAYTLDTSTKIATFTWDAPDYSITGFAPYINGRNSSGQSEKTYKLDVSDYESGEIITFGVACLLSDKSYDQGDIVTIPVIVR